MAAFAEEPSLPSEIKLNSTSPNTVGYINITDRSGGINESTWLYVKNALDYYKKSKPAFIILNLNTPGGEVFAAQKISDALKELDTQYNIPIVAFINNWAISAGAMLAYSSRYIAIVKDASMGAAEPVLASQEGKMESASEKVNSALRSDFANRAHFFGRDPLIAEAMVDKDLILVLRDGKIIKLDNETQIRTGEPNPDLLISPKGKLLTLTAEQLMAYHVANFYLPPEKLEPIAEQEREKGKWPAVKELLFHHPDFSPYAATTTIDEYQMDWKTRFFVFLANPVVSSLLFMGLLIGFYVEISGGGFGLAGTVGVLCLFFIILSSFAMEAANWLELILLFSGLAILLVDLFVLPTFGLLGVFGALFFLVGLVGLMLPGLSSVQFELDSKTFNAAGEFVLQRLLWLCGAFIASIVCIALIGRYLLPRFSPFRRFVLVGGEQNSSSGYYAGEDPKMLPQPGAKGEVAATLRPSGKVVIADTIYDAISDGDFIEKGERIKVVRLEGSVMVVDVEEKET